MRTEKFVSCPQCGYSYNANWSVGIAKHNRYHAVWKEAADTCDFPRDFSSAIERIESEYETLRDLEVTSKVTDAELFRMVKGWCLRKYALHRLLLMTEGSTRYMGRNSYIKQLLEANRCSFGERVYSIGSVWVGEELCA